MTQSKLGSFIEACVNTAIGFIVTIIALPFVNYFCDIHMTGSQMGWSTFIFTIISVARGFVIRRFFNNLDWIKKFLIRKITGASV